MIELKFSDFYKSNYEDNGYVLYFVKDANGKALYIGISAESIWYRWFGTQTSHLSIDASGKFHGSSHIGQVIEGNLPASWNWKIELWTKSDCLKIFAEEFEDKEEDRITVKVLEMYMIHKFNPLYNVSHGGGYHEESSSRKRLDDEYKKIFG